MTEYLGVTTKPGSAEIEICCASEAEARRLANDLSATFNLRDEGSIPAVRDYRITFSGNLWLLKDFLRARRWKLTMDTQTRLMFDREAESSGVNTGLSY